MKGSAAPPGTPGPPVPVRTTNRVSIAAAWITVLTLCASSAAGTPLSAQIVTGSVLDATSSAPLPGVLISLMGTDGERVRAVLSDETGRFVIDVAQFGSYRIRAERIGLRTTTSDSFRLFSTNPHVERILMGDRAVEIAGLVVDTRVQQCRIDRDEAVQIQRWWREVRTALDVSSVIQGEGLAQFRLERFEREWGPELRRIVASSSRTEMSLSNRPFVSAEAAFLADGGYVQGGLDGQREYYAPDAEVLLSNVFLSQHCFALSTHDDDRLLGLTFEPTRDNRIPEVMGTLWVDTTTAELQSLDFRYANMSELPPNESGGQVSFEYLPSGAWIVRDWYIRMPRLGQQRRRGRDRLVLLGYVDVGGEVTPLATASVSMERQGAVGTIRGVVFDSIRGRGLAGATVSVLGTRYQTHTDREGAFELAGVPAGERQITFFHDDPTSWGLGSPFVTAEVEEGRSVRVDLALPGFRQAARIVCMGSGLEAESVLLGVLTDRSGTGLGNATLELTWREERAGSMAYDMVHEVRTGSDGRFVVCTVPAEVVVTVAARVDDRWIEGFEVTLPTREIVYRRLMIPRAPQPSP